MVRGPQRLGVGDKSARGAAVALYVIIECLVAHTAIRARRSRTNLAGVTPFQPLPKGAGPCHSFCHPNCLSMGGIG